MQYIVGGDVENLINECNCKMCALIVTKKYFVCQSHTSLTVIHESLLNIIVCTIRVRYMISALLIMCEPQGHDM